MESILPVYISYTQTYAVHHDSDKIATVMNFTLANAFDLFNYESLQCWFFSQSNKG